MLAAQALWLALALGIVVALVCVVAADPIMSLLAGGSDARDAAARYLRLSALGVPCALIALAGQGYLRGVDRLRVPLVILVAANAVNVVLELVLVYGFDLGLDGSALGTVIAQLGMGVAFAILLLRAAPAWRPHLAQLRALMRVGGDLLVRTGSLLAAFTLASAVLARESEPALAAHQIAMQLFVFLALVLDAVAIVFALDGILIGASDTRYIAGAMAFAFLCVAPVVLLAGALDWGVIGVWAALNVLMLARLGTMAARFAGSRWVVLGA